MTNSLLCYSIGRDAANLSEGDSEVESKCLASMARLRSHCFTEILLAGLRDIANQIPDTVGRARAVGFVDSAARLYDEIEAGR